MIDKVPYCALCIKDRSDFNYFTTYSTVQYEYCTVQYRCRHEYKNLQKERKKERKEYSDGEDYQIQIQIRIFSLLGLLGTYIKYIHTLHHT